LRSNRSRSVIGLAAGAAALDGGGGAGGRAGAAAGVGAVVRAGALAGGAWWHPARTKTPIRMLVVPAIECQFVQFCQFLQFVMPSPPRALDDTPIML